MKRRILWSPASRREMDGQVAYFRNISRRLASQFAVTVRDTLRRIAEMPTLGSPYQTTNPRATDLRFEILRPFKNHLILYRFNDAEIEVVRVVHGARHLDSLAPE